MSVGDGSAYRRRQMVAALEQAGVRDRRVLDAMLEVPRHLFVPPRWRTRAYGDSALSIGEGQTISQPLVVARMTEAAAVGADSKVLEIGTGSGYQAAVLSRIVRFVFTVERIPRLAREAKKRLDALGIENVSVKVMDGTLGWSAQAPYDAILVTAGAPEVPRPLLSQLAEGGRLVVPVGDREQQEMVLVENRGGRFITRNLGGAAFVPLIGRFGWEGDGEAHR